MGALWNVVPEALAVECPVGPVVLMQGDPVLLALPTHLGLELVSYVGVGIRDVARKPT